VITVFVGSTSPRDYHLINNPAISRERKVCASRRHIPCYQCYYLFYYFSYCEYKGYAKGFHDIVTGHLFVEFTKYLDDEIEY
jgi:hypothetical protein